MHGHASQGDRPTVIRLTAWLKRDIHRDRMQGHDTSWQRLRYVNSAGVCPAKTKRIHVAQSGGNLTLFSPQTRRFATEKTRGSRIVIFPLSVNIPESGKRKMAVRIGKGSSDDPFCLDDGVKSREGHYILWTERKTRAARQVAGNYRKRNVVKRMV